MLLFARAPPAAPAFPAIPKESETNLVSDILGASPTTMLGACRFRHPNVSLESSSSARRCADGGFTNYIRPTQMSQKVYAKPAAHTLAVGKSAFLFVFLCLFCSRSARFVLIFDSWSITSSVQSAGHKDVIARWLTCIKNTW